MLTMIDYDPCPMCHITLNVYHFTATEQTVKRGREVGNQAVSLLTTCFDRHLLMTVILIQTGPCLQTDERDEIEAMTFA